MLSSKTIFYLLPSVFDDAENLFTTEPIAIALISSIRGPLTPLAFAPELERFQVYIDRSLA
jgi:hypothetical protein